MSRRGDRAADRFRATQDASRTLHRRGDQPPKKEDTETISPSNPRGNVLGSSLSFDVQLLEQMNRSMHGQVFSVPTQSAPPTPPRTSGVSWDDVVGLDDAKEALCEALVYPTTYRELYATYGQVPPKGVLLYGPAGCGKTMLGKAAATAVGANLNDTHAGGFQYVAGPELSAKYIGETAQKIRGLFACARDYSKRAGRPGVIFIDEADAVLGQRGRVWTDPESVPSFLTEMDGMRDTGSVFVMLGTNRQGVLDTAITRDGRIDRRIEIPRPGHAAIARLVTRALGLAPLHQVDAEAAGQHVAALTLGDELVVQELGLVEGRTISIYLRDCINGASTVGIVRRAIAYAIERDRKSGNLVSVTGVRLSDLERAASATAAEMRGTNLDDVAVEVVGRAVGEEAARKWAQPTDAGHMGEKAGRSIN